ncbi:MAG: gliding motility protein GldM [Muribaculaceae bacterium]|nr:gliding motility protein GldM [Muribaculaceae bacterium]
MSQSNMRLSPRQKMINLMYIVLTAMLALNVSSDVLNGFTQVQDGLSHTNDNFRQRNDAVFATLETAAAVNPEKAGEWHSRALQVRQSAAGICATIDSLKLAIVRKADGPAGNPDNIDNRENLEASSVIMLSPVSGNGAALRKQIDSFRSFVSPMISDSITRTGIEAMLSTAPHRSGATDALRSWEVVKFENQPVVAAVALLSKLQNDVLYAEGEALSSLASAVDAGDVRVNRINAFVIPESRYVMKGNPYRAEIVLAAVDTTARPALFIDGKKLDTDGSTYSFVPGSSGSYTYSGYLEMPLPDGTSSRHSFTADYVVMDPVATVSASLMNVLYAGIDNPIEISVPGIPQSSVSATMTNGTLVKDGGKWIARPTAAGQNATISVSASTPDGHAGKVAAIEFKVRRLPDPTAYLPGGEDGGARFKGERPITKAALMNTDGIGAAIDDGVLDIEFKVLGFETVFFDSMGNAIPEVSDGASFSRRQKESFRRLTRGKRFYISRIRAIGPDGIERTLSPLEITVN